MTELLSEPTIRSMSDPGLHQSRVGGDGMQWLRALVVGVIAMVVALVPCGRPAPALHGGGFVVLGALLVLVLSTAILLRGLQTDRVRVVVLGAMTAASSTLVWVQRGGPAIAGIFVGVSYAAIALPTRRSLPVLAIAVIELPVLFTHAHKPVGRIGAVEFSIIAFYLVASVARRSREGHERTHTLLETMRARHAALYADSRRMHARHESISGSLSDLIRELTTASSLADATARDGELARALERAHRPARSGAQQLDGGLVRDETRARLRRTPPEPRSRRHDSSRAGARARLAYEPL